MLPAEAPSRVVCVFVRAYRLAGCNLVQQYICLIRYSKPHASSLRVVCVARQLFHAAPLSFSVVP